MDGFARIFAWSGALCASYLVVSLILIKAAGLSPLPVLVAGGVVVWLAMMGLSIGFGVRNRRRPRNGRANERQRASR
jgi:hypothetical protein